MIFVHISYREDSKKEWEDILVYEFKPFSELYPDEGNRKGSYGINEKSITIPSGETFQLTAYFSKKDNLLNYLLEQDGETILTNSSYKKYIETFDPSINIKLSSGSYLAITFSSLKEVEAM